MTRTKINIVICFILFGFSLSVFSQTDSTEYYNGVPHDSIVFTVPEHVQVPLLNIDSIKNSGKIILEHREKSAIELDYDQSLKFLGRFLFQDYWKNDDDPLKTNIERLMFFASQPVFDTTEMFLTGYPYDSIEIPWHEFYVWDTLRFTFMADLTDSASRKTVNDNFLNDSSNVGIQTDNIDLTSSLNNTMLQTFGDTTLFVLADTLDKVEIDTPAIPFNYYTAPYQTDSLEVAIKSLILFVQRRDSSYINITGPDSQSIPILLNSRTGSTTRYWLKNNLGDSITIWISTPARNTINVDLERGISFVRPILQSTYTEARIERNEIDNTTLLETSNIYIKKRYWKTRVEASFALNQTGMSNWVSGGENSISILTDIVGYADYENEERKMTSSNFARLKFGLVTSQEFGFRKNVDLLETSSKINTKAFGDFDFSGYMLIKTTIAKGYKYPNDSVAVSKFFNPVTLTLGLGLDYKPNKNMSVNISPISYKGTFITDTTNIDQTLYGLEKDKKSKHEPGLSILLTNTWDISEQIKMTNKIQLFTNYINKPQNVDIDWEMTFTAKLNWFTDFKLNTHFIFDDNTKTLEFDKEDNPVLWPNGVQKKNARVQFKEIIGFSFVFRF